MTQYESRLIIETSAGAYTVPIDAKLPLEGLPSCAAEKRAREGAEPAAERLRATATTCVLILFGIFVQLVVGECMKEVPPQANEPTAATTQESKIRSTGAAAVSGGVRDTTNTSPPAGERGAAATAAAAGRPSPVIQQVQQLLRL